MINIEKISEMKVTIPIVNVNEIRDGVIFTEEVLRKTAEERKGMWYNEKTKQLCFTGVIWGEKM